jgi:hypothetical protein
MKPSTGKPFQYNCQKCCAPHFAGVDLPAFSLDTKIAPQWQSLMNTGCKKKVLRQDFHGLAWLVTQASLTMVFWTLRN